MTEADVQRLLAEKKIQTVAPDPETARAEIDVARRHIASAGKDHGRRFAACLHGAL